MTDVPDGTSAAEALVAVIDMIEDRYDGTICQRDYDVITAAAPVIAAQAAAEPRWHCTADPATVPCGRCVACRCDHVDAYQAGAAAQREADIKLARDYRVMVCLRRNDDGTVYYLHRKDFYPFADLLAAAPEETGIRAAVTAVCDSMGIDPEQPMTADQHAEFGPRLAAALAAEAVR